MTFLEEFGIKLPASVKKIDGPCPKCGTDNLYLVSGKEQCSQCQIKKIDKRLEEQREESCRNISEYRSTNAE